ncbi:MAG: recombinase family protein [Lachnospiraceae bacterium]|nr:recombinase family protein [Lachnospiraceae bacterium]
MGKIYGYARCSTNESKQDISRQKRDLKALGVRDDKSIYYEYASGTKDDRVELQKLLEIIRPGDSIAATEVSRLTRSTKHLCELLKTVQERKIQLIIGSFVVDCRNEDIDPMTKGMLMMWSVFAEMERDIISQRVKSGMENARSKGKHIGRPSLTSVDLPPRFFQKYQLYADGKLNISDFSRIMGCSRTTIYKYIRMVNLPKNSLQK